MSDSRFNLIMALYVFCMDYHSGQSSRGYRILSRIQTRYRPNLRDAHIAGIQSGFHDEWLDSHAIYLQLVRDYAGKV